MTTNRAEWAARAGKAKILPGTSHTVAGPADGYVFRMEDANTLFKKVLAAEFALKADPGCIEALVFMGTHLRDPSAAMRHLEHAVAVGDALWAPVAAAEGDDMVWWGCVATRPYMRAIQALGMAQLDVGREDEARACFERLLEMNPNDNQGIRSLVGDVETEMAFSM